MGINPASLITPAIILSATAYLVRFFGKVVADQKPFADDRNWEIELSGVMFILAFVFWPGLLAFFIFSHWKISTNSWWSFAVISILHIIVVLNKDLLLEKIYKVPSFFGGIIKKSYCYSDEEWKSVPLKITKSFPSVLFQIIALIMLYVLIEEIDKGNWKWSLMFLGEVFFSFIIIALNYSLITTKLPKINIHFNDGDILSGVSLLKMNNDNIRVREGEKTLIINRLQISYLEYIDAEQEKKC